MKNLEYRIAKIFLICIYKDFVWIDKKKWKKYRRKDFEKKSRKT